jgi:hypothetical protein
VLAAAGVHGGTEPDLLDEVASWQADDFWQYAMHAAVACIRAAASRAGVLSLPGPRRAPWPPGAIAPNRRAGLTRQALPRSCADHAVLRAALGRRTA